MNKDQLIVLLKNNHLSPNFTYGQNFLIDDIILEDIVDAAEVTPADQILEIGPGIGNLTRRLCERAGFVLSIEKDPKFLPILKAIKKDCKNFRFEIADALKFNFQEILAADYKVVANIPYYITGKILQMLMTAAHKPTTITMLMQKEVAEQVAAEPGDLSILAISVQLYGNPEIVHIVPARSFYPAPKVDSALLKIEVAKKPKYKINDGKHFFGIIKACFSSKRKQLHNTLVNNLHLEKTQALDILAKLKINPAARPQELSLDDWVKLANLIK